MKRNALIFGLILGTILTGNMVYMVNRICNDPNLETNDVIGYVVMVVVFSLIFFGIRNYRDKQLGGMISFGKAFKTGTLIALIGSTIYVGVWLFYYYLFVPDFIGKYAACAMNQAARHGATDAELAAKSEEMSQFKEMYQSPFFVVLISYAEVLPVGLVVTLVSSLVLKRKSRT